MPAGVVPTWGWNQLFVEDHTQQWWVPTTSGLFRFPAVRLLDDFARARPLKVYTTREGLSGNEPFRLFEDSRGDLWISIISTPSEAYLNRWERATDKIHSYPQAIASRQDSAPTAFQQDRTGNLWIGFYWGGLARLRPDRFDKFDTFTKADGVPIGMIRALYLDQKGRLWIATAEGGLGRIDDPQLDHPKIIQYKTKDGLSSDQVSCITEDQWGRIYVGTGVGIDRLDPETGRVKRYTIADGLPNGFVNIAYRDRSNALWFGTLQGLSKLVPTMDGPPQAPPILIQRVRVAGDELPISQLGATQIPDAEFAANKNQFEINFVSLGFRTGDVLRYQFKLEGADNDWSPPTNQRSVNYANLKPGSYRFRVRALNADGMFSIEPASFSFTIVPPIWQRWWFIVLAVLALAGVTHLAYWYHTRRLIELERVRTRIATDLHDDIGANLSKISILSDVASQGLSSQWLSTSPTSPAATPLAQIAETSRDCVDAMSDIVWAINPQRDHLTDLTHRMRRFAEDLFDAKEIDFTVQSALDEKDVRLGSELRREVYLIFKECVNNLVKHADCRRAELMFSVDGPYLMVSISDDGKGFNSNGNVAGMGGHGLANMQRRAQALGGSLKIDSEVGRGTKVTLRVPIRQRSRWLSWPFNYPNGG